VPGTLLVARVLGEPEESEAALRAARDDDGWWTQHLYGHDWRNLGPVHGLLGNLIALDAVDEALPKLRELARREGAHVNWPPGPEDEKMRLQWCHGAPGILIHAGAVLDEDLLLGAAELTWEAGPLDRNEKGAGICHGTAGNGYALLRVFELTQDELWLSRARAFAVHALEQALELPPRYSLFTGGIGAALFAQDCLDALVRFPVFDWLTRA
jgi:lanthionine synthetase-like protein